MKNSSNVFSFLTTAVVVWLTCVLALSHMVFSPSYILFKVKGSTIKKSY